MAIFTGEQVSGNGDITNPNAWAVSPVLTGEVAPAGGAVDLSWDLRATKAYANLASYTLYRRQDSGSFTVLAVLDVNTDTYVDTALVHGSDYTYYLAATWGDGTQLPSNRVVVSGALTEVFLTSNTWVPRPGVVSLVATARGVGGGGGSGQPYDNGNFNTGYSGAGGGGGGYAQVTLVGSIPSSVIVTVGTAGVGGAAQPAEADGNDGTNGTTTSFGTFAVANGGQGGKGGTSGSLAGGAGGTASITVGTGTTETGGIGGDGDISNNSRTDVHPGAGTVFAGGGGGGGGYLATDSVATAAGAGGDTADLAGGIAGTPDTIGHVDVQRTATGGTGSAGGSSTAGNYKAGAGAGGGGAAGAWTTFPHAIGNSAISGAGGQGGLYGGGGGGGATAQSALKNGNGSGSGTNGAHVASAGGNGGPGVIVVTSYRW